MQSHTKKVIQKKKTLKLFNIRTLLEVSQNRACFCQSENKRFLKQINPRSSHLSIKEPAHIEQVAIKIALKSFKGDFLALKLILKREFLAKIEMPLSMREKREMSKRISQRPKLFKDNHQRVSITCKRQNQWLLESQIRHKIFTLIKE